MPFLFECSGVLPVIPELGRQRQEDYCKLEGNILGIYTERTFQEGRGDRGEEATDQ